MEIVDLFMEKSKDKFLNMLVKIPKAYDWYLGIVIKLDDYIRNNIYLLHIYLI